MTRKSKISLLILVWCIVAIQIFVNYRQKTQNEQEAVTTFSEVRSAVLEEMIAGYGYVGRVELSEKMRKKMLQNLADKLELQGAYTWEKSSGETYEKWELINEMSDQQTNLQLVSMGQEQYLLVHIDQKGSVEQGKETYEQVKRVYEEIGVKGTVNMEYLMEQKGNRTADSEEFVTKLFEKLDAEMVDEIRDDDLCIIYGYRKEEPTYLMYHEKKTNLQIVMSYDEKAKKTYIKIGIPLVNSSY